MLVPSPVLTQLKAIFEKDTQADCVALVWPEVLHEPMMPHEVAGNQVSVVYCPSELAMRQELTQHRGSERLILLSRFDETHLAKDVLARLWRNEPQRISPWKTLQQLLKVHSIDPRLTKSGNRWLADSLLSCFDAYQNKISFGEVLDQENAWKALALGLLGYEEPTLDLPSLFQWSLKTDAAKAIQRMPTEARDNLSDWLQLALRGHSELIHRLLDQNHANELMAIGLVCSVLYHPDLSRLKIVEPHLLFQAQGRFTERFLGGQTIAPLVLREYGEEAVRSSEHLLRTHRAKLLGASFSKAEQTLASLDLLPATICSPVLPAGLAARLDRLAEHFKKAIDGKPLEPVREALISIKSHFLSTSTATREQIRRAEMALRLCEWLQSSGLEKLDVNSIIDSYLLEGGFVDWARSKIWAGDVHEGLSAVYQMLSRKVSAKRETQNHAFAQHLSVIARGDQLHKRFIPVENVLDRLLAPIAQNKQVLLLVLDGMSQAVYRELTEDLTQHNWIELENETTHGGACLLSALPTITKVSRCSLLSGRLCQGLAPDEKKAFANHPELKKLASSKFPPRLFHKSDLQQFGSGALASEVRAVIAGTEHRITALVVNAIDDQLSSNAQVALDWSIETVSLLRQILEAARESGRVIIITSDHGHVLDHDMAFSKPTIESGERYRTSPEPVVQGEIKVAGTRVVLEPQSVILPWSEKIRYTPKKLGYHGGGSLQEVIIPLGIFTSAADSNTMNGWKEIPRYLPNWWEIASSRPQTAILTASTVETKPSAKPKKQPTIALPMDDLFDGPAPTPAAHNLSWIEAITASTVFVTLKERAGRTAIREEQLIQLLTLLVKHNGQLMEPVLVQGLAIPQIRLRGFLASAQKLINVDGYPILSIDRDSGTVKLNIPSLKKQFEL